MAKIYLANATKQHLKHCYRLRESGQLAMVEIPSGQQQLLGEAWTDSQVEGFVQHLEKCGFRRANETHRKLTEFSGWLYSVGKPIGETQIYDGHDALVDHQEHRSAEEATKSALAFDAANRPQKDRRKRLAKVTEITVEQDVPPREQPTGKEVQMRITVAEDGATDKRAANLPI